MISTDNDFDWGEMCSCVRYCLARAQRRRLDDPDLDDQVQAIILEALRSDPFCNLLKLIKNDTVSKDEAKERVRRWLVWRAKRRVVDNLRKQETRQRHYKGYAAAVLRTRTLANARAREAQRRLELIRCRLKPGEQDVFDYYLLNDQPFDERGCRPEHAADLGRNLEALRASIYRIRLVARQLQADEFPDATLDEEQGSSGAYHPEDCITLMIGEIETDADVGLSILFPVSLMAQELSQARQGLLELALCNFLAPAFCFAAYGAPRPGSRAAKKLVSTLRSSAAEFRALGHPIFLCDSLLLLARLLIELGEPDQCCDLLDEVAHHFGNSSLVGSACAAGIEHVFQELKQKADDALTLLNASGAP